jgi:hypothetical protein
MKKQLVMLVLALAVAATAQQVGQPAAGQPAGQPGQAQPGPGQQPAQQKKEIKDPAEYNSYVGAIQTPDAQQKIVALEDFLTRYPNTVVKGDALEQLMGAYQQTGNGAKTVETANRILQVEPNNLPGLAISVLSLRGTIAGAQDPKLAQMRAMAERGVQALQSAIKPEGLSDADWTTRKKAFGTVFHGGLGFAALQANDYPAAQQHLRMAVEASPDNFADVYPLALAYLQARPMVADGLWFAARAVNLAPAQAQQSIATWAQGKYRKYHGGDDGWQELLAQARTQPMPPAGFSIKPAPTPQEMAQQLAVSKDPARMTPDELELVLIYGDQAAQGKVWASLKGVPQQFQGKIIDVPAKTELLVAFSADAIESNHANVDLTMAGPIPASLMPQVGAMIPLQGTPVSYTITPGQGTNPPTLLIKMSDGALLTAGGKKSGAKPAPKRSGRKPR